MLSELRPAVLTLVAFTLLTGLVYPLVVTGVAQVALPARADGSPVVVAGTVVGSALIGQPFTEARYFWGRPSATATPAGAAEPYDAMSSGADNLGPSSPDLAKAVRARVAALRAADPAATGPVPVDLVTTSASGLDPDLSPAAAYYQVHRVAVARGVADAMVRAIVDRHVEPRTFGVLGDPHVNVLALNLDLDARTPETAAAR